MGTITYNDKYKDINKAFFYDASTGTYTDLGRDGHNIDYFPNNAVAGDCVIFPVHANESGKYNEIKFNVLTPLVATAITVIWEYARRTGGGWSAPAWYSLAGVVDNTNAFQNAGVNSVTFTCPEDWENYFNPSGMPGTYYQWFIRCRIVSTTALTEGGKQTADAIVVKPNTIWISGFSSGTPCTLQDIYDEDVSQSWGVVVKNDNCYTFNCGLQTDTSTGYFTTKQEIIQFKKNWNCKFYGVIKSGEVVSGSKCKNGSEFIFYIYNGSLFGGVLAYTDAEIYNTHYRHINMEGSSHLQGLWGGYLGQASGQKIYDIYGEGLRQFSFNYDGNVIIGAKGYGFHVEYPGAILKDITCYGGGYAVRPITNSGDYMHTCDFSGVTTSPINPYRATKIAFVMDFVDCNWGTFEKTHYASWYTSSGDAYVQGWIWIVFSFLLKLIDKDNNAISGATIVLKDKDDTEVFSYTTNADGAPGQDSGTASSATASTITDTSKSWTSNQWWFKEIYITSGTGAGQRRIIKKGNTATELQVAPDWDTTPNNTSKYIVIPYVRATQILSPITEPATGYHWSTAVDKNPFTIKISKAGYQTYEKKFTLDRKFDEKIGLRRIAIVADSEVIC